MPASVMKLISCITDLKLYADGATSIPTFIATFPKETCKPTLDDRRQTGSGIIGYPDRRNASPRVHTTAGPR
jgi:hypothetical protein